MCTINGVNTLVREDKEIGHGNAKKDEISTANFYLVYRYWPSGLQEHH